MKDAASTLQRIDVRTILDSYHLGAPRTDELHKWERLLLVRFWEPVKERANTYRADQPPPATAANWELDPDAWTPVGDADADADELNDKLEKASRKAADYVYTIINRQLSKVAGLLNLNSVLLAVFAFARTLGNVTWTCGDTCIGWLALVGSLSAISSIAMLIKMLAVGWGAPLEAESHRANLRFALTVATARTRSITLAVRASAIALTCGAAVISLTIGRHLAPNLAQSAYVYFCSAIDRGSTEPATVPAHRPALPPTNARCPNRAPDPGDPPSDQLGSAPLRLT